MEGLHAARPTPKVRPCAVGSNQEHGSNLLLMRGSRPQEYDMNNTHTARWRLDLAQLSCGHTLTVRHGEASAYCSWCAQSVNVLALAA